MYQNMDMYNPDHIYLTFFLNIHSYAHYANIHTRTSNTVMNMIPE